MSNRRSKFREGLLQSRRSGEALEHSPGRVEARNPGQADAKTARLWGQGTAWDGNWPRWADLGKAGLSLCRADGPHLLGSWSLLGGPGYRSATEDTGLCCPLLPAFSIRRTSEVVVPGGLTGARHTVGAQYMLQPLLPSTECELLQEWTGCSSRHRTWPMSPVSLCKQ